MKLTAALAAISIASSTVAFTPEPNSARSTTELYKYAPTKWSPKGGSNPNFDAFAATTAAPAQPEVEVAPVSETYSSIASSLASSSSGTKKGFSPTHWTPQGGATGGSLWGADSSAAVAAIEEAPTTSSSPAAVAASIGPKKNYSGTHWSPQNGATGGSLWGVAAPALAAAVAATSSSAEPVPAAATPRGTKKNYSAVHWSPQDGATGSKLWGVAAIDAPVAEAPAAPEATTALAASAAPKKGYSATHWTPQGGATGGSGFM